MCNLKEKIGFYSSDILIFSSVWHYAASAKWANNALIWGCPHFPLPHYIRITGFKIEKTMAKALESWRKLAFPYYSPFSWFSIHFLCSCLIKTITIVSTNVPKWKKMKAAFVAVVDDIWNKYHIQKYIQGIRRLQMVGPQHLSIRYNLHYLQNIICLDLNT